MVDKAPLDKFMDLGFSEYEAKAYMALLQSNPATAYEIARVSGIPTSKIYEVLARLLEKAVISVIEEKRKKRYTPLTTAEFIESRKSRLEKTLNALQEDLADIRIDQEKTYIWNIQDYYFLLEKAERIILKAHESILLSGWKEELGVLEASLRRQERKGVQIAAVGFGEPAIFTGRGYQCPREDVLAKDKKGHELVVVADDKAALMGKVFSAKHTEGAWSTNQGFVSLAEDYIKSNIYLSKIIKRFDRLLIAHFDEQYTRLLDVFQDEEAGN